MIGADIAAALPLLRAQAESLMTSTVSVARPGDGGPVWDEATETTVDASTIVYAGPGRLLPAREQYAGVDAAGEAVVVAARVLALPAAAAGVLQDGDLATVDGRTLQVVAAPVGTHMVEVRARCREQQ